MAEETITFELIRKIQLQEQTSNTLTKLPTNFFLAASNYLEQKKKIVSNDDRKGSLEVKNIERLIEDIFNRRERKIINASIIAARSGIPPDNMDESEKPFYNSVIMLIKSRRNETLKGILSGNVEEHLPAVVFKEDVPEFMGIDERSYGPYKKGDTAHIPEENMKIFVERGTADALK